MDPKELARQRRIEELRRRRQQGGGDSPATDRPSDERDDDPDAPLISEGTKQALKGAAAAAQDLTKAGLAEMIEKTKRARDQLQEASKTLAAARPAKPLHPAPKLLPSIEPKPVRVEWPTVRLFGQVELGVIALIAWGLVGAGLVWTHEPALAPPGAQVVADGPLDLADGPSETDPDPGAAAPTVQSIAATPAPPAASPSPTREQPASAAPATQKPKPSPAPEVDDAWTDDANVDMDEWERVLRSE